MEVVGVKGVVSARGSCRLVKGTLVTAADHERLPSLRVRSPLHPSWSDMVAFNVSEMGTATPHYLPPLTLQGPYRECTASSSGKRTRPPNSGLFIPISGAGLGSPGK